MMKFDRGDGEKGVGPVGIFYGSALFGRTSVRFLLLVLCLTFGSACGSVI